MNHFSPFPLIFLNQSVVCLLLLKCWPYMHPISISCLSVIKITQWMTFGGGLLIFSDRHIVKNDQEKMNSLSWWRWDNNIGSVANSEVLRSGSGSSVEIQMHTQWIYIQIKGNKLGEWRYRCTSVLGQILIGSAENRKPVQRIIDMWWNSEEEYATVLGL